MRATTFQHALGSTKGNVLELIEFKIIKISKQIPFGEGTLQNTTCVDADGTEMTVAWMDHLPISENWRDGWFAAESTPGQGNHAGKLFGVHVGEYSGKKRIEVKAKAKIEHLQDTTSAQQAPRQAPQSAPPQRPHRSDSAPQPSYQEQERREQQAAQRPLPQTQPQAPRQAPAHQTITARTWAAKIASVQQSAMDAAVHLAFADKARHGICRTHEQVTALATSIFIELTRKVDWASIPVTDLATTRPPMRPLCELFNADAAPVATDDFRPVSDGMDGDTPTGDDIPF